MERKFRVRTDKSKEALVRVRVRQVLLGHHDEAAPAARRVRLQDDEKALDVAG
jgi:hypothetical protein